jgi:NhaA family Na+:H+ antiporter
MSRHPSRRQASPPAQTFAEKVFSALEGFLHIEAVSGIALLLAAAAALLWANSPAAESYEALWHAPFTVGFGELFTSRPLHFWINEGLMTVFFLVAGLEIRRELYEGALATPRLAAFPLAAALGGVAIPAVIYLAANGGHDVLRSGWAIPTATDIAFAVGVLALLGKSIPSAIRVFLLALAIIDDVVAVVIIAAFYSGGVDITGLIVAGCGALLVLAFQRLGVGAAYAYVIPGAVLWWGLLHAGVHPALAGVVLGLMTPVVSVRRSEEPAHVLAARALNDLGRHSQGAGHDRALLAEPLKRLRHAQRELVPPVVRVQRALHPWVAYGVMPLFALANAGVSLEGIDYASSESRRVVLGVAAALLIGKPAGILLGSWVAVRLRFCRLPPGVTWRGVVLVGCLGGIGFTMSIFVATLAFTDGPLLAAAKSGVLLGSALAAALGLALGRVLVAKREAVRRVGAGCDIDGPHRTT